MIELYVILALGAATLIGTSVPLQSRGIKQVPDLNPIDDGAIQWGQVKEIIKKIINRYIIVAVILGIAGGLLNMMALSRGDATIVQPLMVVGNLVTVSLGVVWLGENLNKLEYLEIILVLAGIFFLGFATA